MQGVVLSSLLIINGNYAPARDADRLTRAACWLERFYPDVTCEAGLSGLVLRSEDRSERQLQDLWNLALLTERLLDDAAVLRSGTLARLGQC
jgi:hypothetical protein